MADRGRQAVAQGGFWSQPKANFSQETQQLLKEMMKESKLTNFQQRQLTKAVKDGESLPRTCHPSSSAKPKAPPKRQPPSKTVDPRLNSPQIRTREQIEATGAYEREMFVPIHTKTFSEKDKERLANIMAYGSDIPPPDTRKVLQRLEPEDEGPVIDRFDELQQEIADRQAFLEEMEQLGHGKEYRSIIDTEISQKIREMELIDKKRTAELEKRIAEEERKRAKDSKGIPNVSIK